MGTPIFARGGTRHVEIERDGRRLEDDRAVVRDRGHLRVRVNLAVDAAGAGSPVPSAATCRETSFTFVLARRAPRATKRKRDERLAGAGSDVIIRASASHDRDSPLSSFSSWPELIPAPLQAHLAVAGWGLLSPEHAMPIRRVPPLPHPAAFSRTERRLRRRAAAAPCPAASAGPAFSASHVPRSRRRLPAPPSSEPTALTEEQHGRDLELAPRAAALSSTPTRT